MTCISAADAYGFLKFSAVNNQEKDCFQRSREGNVSLLSLQDNMSSEVGAFVIFPGITALTVSYIVAIMFLTMHE